MERRCPYAQSLSYPPSAGQAPLPCTRRAAHDREGLSPYQVEADPAATCELAQSYSDWPGGPGYYAEFQALLTEFVQSGQLSHLTNGYWGHPAYNLPPEANLLMTTYYLEALDWQREVIKAHAVLGSKNPHLQTYLVGGMARPVDPNSDTALNADQIGRLRKLFAQAQA
ncbi:MAG: hypothetical protein EHM56_04300, partial [Chloroflexi bacterium]